MDQFMLSILSLILLRGEMTPAECVSEFRARGRRATAESILRTCARMRRAGWLKVRRANDESREIDYNAYSPDWESQALADELIGQHWVAPDQSRWTTWAWETGHTGRVLVLRAVDVDGQMIEPVQRRRVRVNDLGGLRLIQQPAAVVSDTTHSPV